MKTLLLTVCDRRVLSFVLLVSLLLLTVQVTPILWSGQLLWLECIMVVGGLLMVTMMFYHVSEIRVNLMDLLLGAWWLYVVLRVYWHPIYPCAYEVTVYSCLWALYVLLRFVFVYFPLENGVLGYLIMGGACYELLLGVWQVCTGSSLHPLYLATGSFYNPGPYSAYVAMGMSVALVKMSHGGFSLKYASYLKWAYRLFLSMAMLMLLITCSRGAIVSLLVVAVWCYREQVRSFLWYILVMFISLGCILLYVKFGSAMGRIIMWYISSCLIADGGMIGMGIGSFNSEYGKALGHFFSNEAHVGTFAQYADVTDYAFCDILQVGVEQGWIGLLLCVCVMGLSMYFCHIYAKEVFAAMLALLVFSLFSYPFQLLPFQIIGVIFLAYTSSWLKGLPVFSSRKCGILLILVSLVGSKVYCFTKNHVEARESSQTHILLSNPIFIRDSYQLLEYCDEDKNFLFDFAKMLQSNGRYLDSNAILRRGMLISNDPMFLVLMGNNYKAMKMFDDALMCYDIADGMLPNRLYPLYKKMCLWRERGNVRQAKICAGELLRRTPKCSSSAVNDMRAEASRVLNARQ